MLQHSQTVLPLLFKEVILYFLDFYLAFIVFCILFVHVKGLHAKGSYSQKKMLLLHCLKHLVWSLAFTSVIHVHQYLTAIT